MSMLENLAGQAMGGGEGPLQAIFEMVQKYPGGISGLVQAFQEKGLGEVAASWVGKGSNMPVSASQLESVLGDGPLAELVGKLGMDSGAAGGQLASLLPQVIDKLTPDGAVPEGGLEQGFDLIKGLLG